MSEKLTQLPGMSATSNAEVTAAATTAAISLRLRETSH